MIARDFIRLVAIGGVGRAVVGVGIPLGPLRTPSVAMSPTRMGHANATAIVFSPRVVGGRYSVSRTAPLPATCDFGRGLFIWERGSVLGAFF